MKKISILIVAIFSTITIAACSTQPTVPPSINEGLVEEVKDPVNPETPPSGTETGDDEDDGNTSDPVNTGTPSGTETGDNEDDGNTGDPVNPETPPSGTETGDNEDDGNTGDPVNPETPPSGTETGDNEDDGNTSDPVNPETPPSGTETGDNEDDGNTGDPVNPETPSDHVSEAQRYVDANGDVAYIPANFKVSEKSDEQTIRTGLVVIGPDGSEYVWVPTAETELKARDFKSYFSSGSSFSDYWDDTSLDSYKDMVKSVEKYGGFYMGRFEASKGQNGLPLSKRITDGDSGKIWVQYSPQDTTVLCQKLYAENNTVQAFFPWGVNYDTTLQWLIDSGNKTESEVISDSTSWGNYSNDSFSPNANGNYTGKWEETKANNIYDLAGNNWEWTQERCGSSNYVMRGGGYNLMGGACLGSSYPAALRDPLPGNNHHPNVTFRVALYLK